MNVLSAVDATLRLLNWLVPVVYGSTFLSRSIGRVVGATILILLSIATCSVACPTPPSANSTPSCPISGKPSTCVQPWPTEAAQTLRRRHASQDHTCFTGRLLITNKRAAGS
jgi:hypothetical protein